MARGVEKWLEEVRDIIAREADFPKERFRLVIITEGVRKMQSFDNKKLISTDQGTIEQLQERIKELEGQATHHVIGKLPQKGDKVTINGLRYKVVSSDGLEGKLRLRILRPKG